MQNETVLVTGASSGIGRELARRFAADGARLVLAARRAAELEALAAELRNASDTKTLVLSADLAQPGAAAKLVDTLRERDWLPDIVINNAGFGDRGPVADLGLERQQQMMQLNMNALFDLTRLCLPVMLTRGRGGFLNIASTAAFQPGPNMTVYYATKAFVLSFSEGLAEEVRDRGVTVTCLCPGPTQTGFAAEANVEKSRLFRLGTMSAEAVARVGHQAFRARRTVVVAGLKNKLGAFAVRFAPRAFVRKLTYSLQRK